MPKLSIITVNLNNVEGLKKTLSSVFLQSCEDFEFIVIDGGSIDGSADILKTNNYRISHWCSEKDNGIFHAMNKGIKQARGEYCMFLNSGDWIYDKKTLEKVFESERSEDILYGNSIVVNNGNRDYLVEEPESLTFKHFYTNSICHQSMFIRRTLFSDDRYGLYREDLKIASDWEFNIRAIVMGSSSIKHLPFPVVYYDYNGLSNNDRTLSLNERRMILAELIPDRLLADMIEIGKLEKELYRIKKSKSYKILSKIFEFTGLKLF